VPFWLFYYHLVWSTKYRETTINDAIGEFIRHEFNAICREREAIPHALGLMPDHVHFAVSIPPKVAIAEFLGEIKGKTSFKINQRGLAEPGIHFRWQTEYGALSFGERSLDSVVAYVKNQAQHHAENTLWPTFERMDTKP
jgi:putative transposase